MATACVGTDPAYPCTQGAGSKSVSYPGITKRELLAAQLLCGLLGGPQSASNVKQSATAAVQYADALIAALSQ